MWYELTGVTATDDVTVSWKWFGLATKQKRCFVLLLASR